MLYTCTKFHENIPKDFSSPVDMIYILKITMSHNFVKTVGGINLLILFISFDDASYLYQVSRNYLKGLQS